LKKESRKKEIFFTTVPEDSLQINFNDGFDRIPLTVKVDGVEKIINNSTDKSSGFTSSIRFKRPKSWTVIEISYLGLVAYIEYNLKYNMVHVWYSDCHLTVRHTNRLMKYE
jgi:hypothetical protein